MFPTPLCLRSVVQKGNACTFDARALRTLSNPHLLKVILCIDQRKG
jgi:hypothetical protein